MFRMVLRKVAQEEEWCTARVKCIKADEVQRQEGESVAGEVVMS